MHTEAHSPNSSFMSTIKNPSLATTGRDLFDRTYNYSRVLSQVQLPINSRISEEEEGFLIDRSQYMMDRNEERSREEILLMQQTICYLANKFNSNQNKIHKLNQLVELKTKENERKEKIMKQHKKTVQDKISKKHKHQKQINSMKKQSAKEMQTEIQRIKNKYTMLEEEMEELIHQFKYAPKQQSPQQQPIVIVIPPSYPPPYQPHHSYPPYQESPPENSPYLNPPPQMYHQSQTIQYHPNQEHNPLTGFIHGPPNPQKPNILLGPGMGNLIAQGFNLKTLSNNGSQMSRKESLTSSKAPKTAQEIELFKKKTQKLKASGKWEVDEEDSDLNLALSRSLKKQMPEPKSNIYPQRIEQSKISVDVQESIPKSEALNLKIEKIKRSQLKQSNIKLELPDEDEKSRSRQIDSFEDKKKSVDIKQVVSPPSVKKIQSHILEDSNTHSKKRNTENNKSKIIKRGTEESAIDIEFQEDLLETSNNPKSTHKRSISDARNSTRKKQQKQPSDPPEESNLVLYPSNIKQSQKPNLPLPPMKKSNQVKTRTPETQSMQIQFPPSEVVNVSRKNSSEISKKNSAVRKPSTSQSKIAQLSDDSYVDDELGDLKLLAVSKLSTDKISNSRINSRVLEESYKLKSEQKSRVIPSKISE